MNAKVTNKKTKSTKGKDASKIKPAVLEVGGNKKQVSQKGLSSLKVSNYYQEYLNKKGSNVSKANAKKAFADINLSKTKTDAPIFDEVTSPISYTRDISTSGYAQHFERPEMVEAAAPVNQAQRVYSFHNGAMNQANPYARNIYANNRFRNFGAPAVPSFLPSQYVAQFSRNGVSPVQYVNHQPNPQDMAYEEASTVQLMNFNPLEEYSANNYNKVDNFSAMPPLPAPQPRFGQPNNYQQNALMVQPRNQAEAILNFIGQATKVLSSVQEQIMFQNKLLQRQQEQMMKQQEIIDSLQTKYLGFVDENSGAEDIDVVEASVVEPNDVSKATSNAFDVCTIDKTVPIKIQEPKLEVAPAVIQTVEEPQNDEIIVKTLPTGEIDFSASAVQAKDNSEFEQEVYTKLVADKGNDFDANFEKNDEIVQEVVDEIDHYTNLVEEEIVPTRVIDKAAAEQEKEELDPELEQAKLDPSKRYWESLVGKAKYGFYNNKVWNWYGYFDRLAKWHKYDNIDQMPVLPTIHAGLISLKSAGNKPFWEQLVDNLSYGHREEGVWIWDGVFDQNCNWVPDPTNPKYYTQNIVANAGLNEKSRALIGNEQYGYYDDKKKWVWTGTFDKNGEFVSDIVKQEAVIVEKDVTPVQEADLGILPVDKTKDIEFSVQTKPEVKTEEIEFEHPEALKRSEMVCSVSKAEPQPLPVIAETTQIAVEEPQEIHVEDTFVPQPDQVPMTIPSYDESVPAHDYGMAQDAISEPVYEEVPAPAQEPAYEEYEYIQEQPEELPTYVPDVNQEQHYDDVAQVSQQEQVPAIETEIDQDFAQPEYVEQAPAEPVYEEEIPSAGVTEEPVFDTQPTIEAPWAESDVSQEPTYDAEVPAEPVVEPAYDAEVAEPQPTVEAAWAESDVSQEPTYDAEAPAEPTYDDAPSFDAGISQDEPVAEPAYDDAPSFDAGIGEEQPIETPAEPAYDDVPSFDAGISEEQAVEPQPEVPAEPTYDAPSFDAGIAEEPQPEAPAEPTYDDVPSFDAGIAQEEPVQDDAPSFDAGIAQEEPQPEPTTEVPSFDAGIADEPAQDETPSLDDNVPAEPTTEAKVEPTTQVEQEPTTAAETKAEEPAKAEPVEEKEEDPVSWEECVGKLKYGHYDQDNEWVWAGYFDDNNKWVKDESYVCPELTYIPADAKGNIDFDKYEGNTKFGYYDANNNWDWYDGYFDDNGNWFLNYATSEEEDTLPALKNIDTDAVDADEWLAQFDDVDASEIFK